MAVDQRIHDCAGEHSTTGEQVETYLGHPEASAYFEAWGQFVTQIEAENPDWSRAGELADKARMIDERIMAETGTDSGASSAAHQFMLLGNS